LTLYNQAMPTVSEGLAQLTILLYKR